MKHITILLATMMAYCSVASQNLESNLTYNTAYYWFKRTLKTQEFPRLTIDKAAKADADIVWQAWLRALSEEECALPSPTDISDPTTGTWNIPDSLEPNAKLNFYYTTKGESSAPRPLFIYLHGSGPRDMEWASGLKLARIFDDAPSTYFIPQIPQEGEWYRWYQVSKQWFIEKMLRQAMAQGNIDPRRIYLLGISEGGYGSQRLASFYADYLAAAGPMAGGEPLKNAPAENCCNIGFSLLTGDKDYGFFRNTLTDYTRAAFDSLQALYPDEFQHRVELLEGYGHGINYAVMTPWLKTFKRNPYPKHFIWEDYEMHGRHRAGFYNIGVNFRPHLEADKRTRYEMCITDNTVNITVDDIAYTCTQVDSKWGFPIEMKFARSYTPSTSGSITVYLNSELVDLKRKVTVIVNGRKVYSGKVKPTADAMIRSLAIFGDPLRIFPAAIDINI